MLPPSPESPSAKCDLDSDACTLSRPPVPKLGLLFSALPFVITFSALFVAVLHRLFPLLCGGNRNLSSDSRVRRRISALVFSTVLGATGVLAELVLCEVGDWLHGDSRRLAIRIAVVVLLACLILVVPFLQIYSLVESASWDNRSHTISAIIGFCVWIWVFWICGDWIPIGPLSRNTDAWIASKTLSEECLARVGVVGISLMALLAGFGCVSTPWQTFAVKKRLVSDDDLARSQSGLDATYEMISSKKATLNKCEKSLHEKVFEKLKLLNQVSKEGFLGKVMSTVRGNGEAEHKILQMELTGLETMAASLEAELSAKKARHASGMASGTVKGRTVHSAFQGFSLYCVYRIAATTFSHLPHLWPKDSSSFSQNDPITNILAIIAKHWDPDLDRAAWSRQIGFLFSGVIILGSLSSVLTTLRMLSRSSDILKHSAHLPSEFRGVNFALFVSQLCAVYVLASALLLRSNLPSEVSTVLTESLGAPLDSAWVDRLFDGVFLASAAVTLLVMCVGRRLCQMGIDDWEGDDDIEMGKEC